MKSVLGVALLVAAAIVTVSPTNAGAGPPACTITGTTANAVLTGTPGNDVFCGGAGSERMFGLGGDDILMGNAGKDILDGGTGDDQILGGAGVDSIAFTGGASGGVVVDLDTGFPLGTANGPDFGSDALSSIESVLGTTRGDQITGGVVGGSLAGKGGNDTITAGVGMATLAGGPGNDTLEGGAWTQDRYKGGGGDDLILAEDGVTIDDVDGGTGIDDCRVDPGDFVRNCP